jgi:hypothetical protein
MRPWKDTLFRPAPPWKDIVARGGGAGAGWPMSVAAGPRPALAFELAPASLPIEHEAHLRGLVECEREPGLAGCSQVLSDRLRFAQRSTTGSTTAKEPRLPRSRRSFPAFKELPRREDGRADVHKLREVRIARDDALCVGLLCERHEVVIAGIGGQTRLPRRIADQHGVLDQARHERIDMGAVDRRMELGSTHDLLQLSQQQRTDDQVEVPVGPLAEDLRRTALRREQCRDEDVAVQDDAWHSATGGVLLLDRHPHRLFLAHAGACRSAVGKDGLDALAAAQHRQVALVGENDGLGTPVGTDHHRISVGAARTEACEKRRQLGPRISRGKNLINTGTHEPIVAERCTPRDTPAEKLSPHGGCGIEPV